MSLTKQKYPFELRGLTIQVLAMSLVVAFLCMAFTPAISHDKCSTELTEQTENQEKEIEDVEDEKTCYDFPSWSVAAVLGINDMLPIVPTHNNEAPTVELPPPEVSRS